MKIGDSSMKVIPPVLFEVYCINFYYTIKEYKLNLKFSQKVFDKEYLNFTINYIISN